MPRSQGGQPRDSVTASHRPLTRWLGLAGVVVDRLRGAHPAGLRYVEHDSVWPAVPDLSVAVLSAPHADAEGPVDVLAGDSTGRRQLLRDLLQALDLEPDVVDATPLLAPLHTSYLVVLEMEDRQVNRPIRKEIARHDGAVQLGNLGQAEHFDIKPGRLLLILGRDCNVLDLRHLAPPFANDSHGTLVHPL